MDEMKIKEIKSIYSARIMSKGKRVVSTPEKFEISASKNCKVSKKPFFNGVLEKLSVQINEIKSQ